MTTDGESDQADKKDLRDIPFKDRMREILFRHSFFPEDQGVGRWADGNVIFFGWVKGPSRRKGIRLDSGFQLGSGILDSLKFGR